MSEDKKPYKIWRVESGWLVETREGPMVFNSPKRKERFSGDLDSSALVDAFQMIVYLEKLPWIEMSIPREGMNHGVEVVQ